MTLIRRAMWSSLLLATALLSHAHTDEVLDARESPHGGQTRMSGAYHFELVLVKDSVEVKTNPVFVYLTNHADDPIPSAGTSATLTLISSKGKASIQLQPDGDNRLKGSGAYASTPDIKALLTVTMPDQNVEQARFTPLAPRTPAAPADDHQHDHAEHEHKH